VEEVAQLHGDFLNKYNKWKNGGKKGKKGKKGEKGEKGGKGEKGLFKLTTHDTLVWFNVNPQYLQVFVGCVPLILL